MAKSYVNNNSLNSDIKLRLLGSVNKPTESNASVIYTIPTGINTVYVLLQSVIYQGDITISGLPDNVEKIIDNSDINTAYCHSKLILYKLKNAGGHTITVNSTMWNSNATLYFLY